MRAFEEYRSMPAEFWALIKFVSESLGYTERGTVCTYTTDDLQHLFDYHNISYDYRILRNVKEYCEARAEMLNNFVQFQLMDGETARLEFEDLYATYSNDALLCKIPINKQRGNMKKVNYFTAIINILTEISLRNSSRFEGSLGFDDDPGGLVYVFDENNQVVGASSRRFDGAYPSIINPEIVWEIKEYYYATTFGSRVADGVYETQLDGHEFLDIANRTSHKVTHVFL